MEEDLYSCNSRDSCSFIKYVLLGAAEARYLRYG